MITLEKIEEMYAHMHNNGNDTSIKMLYGYFFTNSEPETLRKAAEELKQKDFKYVAIYPDENKLYWLHMERIEVHNSETLHQLNKQLYAIADKYEITSYDGFDLGNVDKNKALKKDTYVVPENFVTNEFSQNDIPYLVIVNKAFEEFLHKNEFYYFLKIETEYSTDNVSKLPTSEEFEALNNFELYFENNLTHNKIKNYYIGRITHNKQRVFYIVTNTKKRTEGVLKFLNTDENQRKYTYKIIEDKEWNIFNDLLKQTNKK